MREKKRGSRLGTTDAFESRDCRGKEREGLTTSWSRRMKINAIQVSNQTATTAVLSICHSLLTPPHPIAGSSMPRLHPSLHEDSLEMGLDRELCSEGPSEAHCHGACFLFRRLHLLFAIVRGSIRRPDPKSAFSFQAAVHACCANPHPRRCGPHRSGEDVGRFEGGSGGQI